MARLHGYPIKPGEHVWHYRFGPCKVRTICDAGIIIEDEEGCIEHGPYDEQGRLCKTDALPSIFWAPVTINFPAKPEPEINWYKVPQGTPVYVSDNPALGWTPHTFVAYTDTELMYGKYVAADSQGYVDSWKYCRLAPDVEVKEEWLS